MIINEKARNELVKMGNMFGLALQEFYKSPDKYKTPDNISKELMRKWYEFDFSTPPNEEHLLIIFDDCVKVNTSNDFTDYKRLINNYRYYLGGI